MIGAVAAGAIALLAMRARSLSRSGAVAATVLGAAAAAAGWDWAWLLVAFFAAAIAVSRYRATEKSAISVAVVQKAGARDATQVLANGVVFGIAATMTMTGDGPWRLVGAGSLAAASADTWATELGLLAHTAPRSITSGRPVAPGTSGGVTFAGTAAGVVGALFLAGVVMAVGWAPGVALAVVAGGVVGTTSDSILGATIQERRWCVRCERATERRLHACGARTELRGGVSGMTNDAVNLVATGIGGLVAMALAAV